MLAAHHEAGDVDVEQVAHELGVEFRDERAVADAGVVDEQIECAEFLRDACEALRERDGVGDVARQHDMLLRPRQ